MNVTPTDRASIVESLEEMRKRHDVIANGIKLLESLQKDPSEAAIGECLQLLHRDIAMLAKAIVTALPDANEPDLF